MPLDFYPLLLNSASPWATTKEELQALFRCPFTGAVTTRTTLLSGWTEDPSTHNCIYFDARSGTTMDERSPNANSTLNGRGYSPIPLGEYLTMIEEIVSESRGPRNPQVLQPGDDGGPDVGKLSLAGTAFHAMQRPATASQLNPQLGGQDRAVVGEKKEKPFIISVTGTADEVVECYELICQAVARTNMSLYMEINLSCPNISNRPPPAYSGLALQEYLFAIHRASMTRRESTIKVPIGLKLSPFTYDDQFTTFIDALFATTGGGLNSPITFITATNTLGKCLILKEGDDVATVETSYIPALITPSRSGIGGVSGSALHPLALGNIRTLRDMLDNHNELKTIDIIGAGGVSDYPSYGRMKSVGP